MECRHQELRVKVTEEHRAGTWVWYSESLWCPQRGLLRGILQVEKVVLSFSLSKINTEHTRGSCEITLMGQMIC